MKKSAFSGVLIREIDNALRVYTDEKYPHSTPNLLLICRGWYGRTHNSPSEIATFTLPSWLSLFFYAPHDSVLHCSNLKLLKNKYAPQEICSPGAQVTDYQLEPFSEIDCFNENTYKELFLQSHPSDMKQRRHVLNYYDILTLEPCRQNFMILPFREVIDRLHDTGYQKRYSNLHCSFDRIPVQSGSRPNFFRPAAWPGEVADDDFFGDWEWL
ncbi:putative adhesin [Endozoicomonas euniceicola]|uniref:Putative adhesin Stv domain-containing protein n=1 Tax=Endozoicomonas euniceicola TaxID=1234143 RepID=A0ABY6GQ22_9GAMM|nr:hypothetical protein [Endozoicomonas euniceicola]UYM14104.1 hypothetical protein NX720_14430 [Endozoicomonas euniceicola]